MSPTTEKRELIQDVGQAPYVSARPSNGRNGHCHRQNNIEATVVNERRGSEKKKLGSRSGTGSRSSSNRAGEKSIGKR